MGFRLTFLLFVWIPLAFGQQYKYSDVSTMLKEEKSFSYEEFLQSLTGKKISNLEEFISSLPEEMKKNYVLIYESKSLQSAQFQKPRVILRSPLSEVMITFTDPEGSSNQHDQNVELMYWDKTERAFKMKEITFDKGTYKVSETNPSKCLECHGSDPRPNWEPYSTWAGVYGGDAEFRFGGELVPGERKQIDQFIKSAAGHPLYKNLANLKENFKVEPSFTGGEEAKGLMSYKFTESLTKLNFQRIVRQMKANPEYEKFKFASLYMASPNCDPGKSPFPSSLSKLNIYMTSGRSNDLIDLYQRFGTDTSKWSMSFRGSEKDIRLASPDGHNQNMVYAMLEADEALRPFFNKRDPLNWKDNTFWQYGESEMDCDSLRKKSLESLENLTFESFCESHPETKIDQMSTDIADISNKSSDQFAISGKETIQTICIHCHDKNSSRNFFENDTELAKKIKNDPKFIDKVTKRLRSTTSPMPPKGQLSVEKQADLIKYLQSFTRNQRSGSNLK